MFEFSLNVQPILIVHLKKKIQDKVLVCYLSFSYNQEYLL